MIRLPFAFDTAVHRDHLVGQAKRAKLRAQAREAVLHDRIHRAGQNLRLMDRRYGSTR